MKKYLLLYDDETGRYDTQKLIDSFQKYNNIEVILFKKSSIEKGFVEKHKDIFECQRGGGYWLWKPYIIHETLKQIEEDSLLFYIDSSYTCVSNMDFVFSYVEKNDVLVWKNKPNTFGDKMKHWCKMDVMQKYFDYNLHANDEICWAGAVVVKNSAKSKSVINDWLDLCSVYKNITDSPSVLPNSPEFIEHRHDQSLLTIVLHRYHIPQYFLTTDFLHSNRNPINTLKPGLQPQLKTMKMNQRLKSLYFF